MTPEKPDTRKRNDLPSAGDTAPMDRDSHGNAIERVPGPGPNDEGKGAAGEEAVERLKKG
jgi:hypothetical protein